MHGGAVTLAKAYMESDLSPDIIVTTDMLDLATFLSLTRKKTALVPTALYCHENQLTYPWSPQDQDPKQNRDRHYAFINYTSALAADIVLFNSNYHFNSFFAELPIFLRGFPDHNELVNVDMIKAKSRVLPLGLDLLRYNNYQQAEPTPRRGKPLILWNHRWEYDKNPEEFFQALFRLHDEGLPFELALLGKSYRNYPEIFDIARRRLKEHILHFGYVASFSDYARWLWRSDIVPVTSHHDFFGISVVEAIYCENFPLLPRRLAYPEHIPTKWQDCSLYSGSDNFIACLKKVLYNLPNNRAELKDHVARYDWATLADHYDDIFESMLP